MEVVDGGGMQMSMTRRLVNRIIVFAFTDSDEWVRSFARLIEEVARKPHRLNASKVDSELLYAVRLLI